jgi:dihydrofolate reductase
MEITLIAAVAKNGVIGGDGGIPWHLPRDTAHFRHYCAGKALLVGRRTFEEMRGWFHPDQLLFVLTKTDSFQPHTPHARTVREIPDAIQIAQTALKEELVVIGGAAVYESAMEHATKLVITEVDTTPPGSARFPEIDPSKWSRTSWESFPADEDNSFDLTFSVWEQYP